MRGNHRGPVFTRAIAILLAAAAGLVGCESATDPRTSELPGLIRIEAVTATAVTGTVGTELTPVPTVRASDPLGKPVPGVTISFRLDDGGGTLASALVETDASGSASVGRWTLGPAPGTYRLTAQSAGRVHVTFIARAEVGPIAGIARVSGNAQMGTVREELSTPLVVVVADSLGNRIPGALVTFRVIAGNGSIEQGSVRTRPDGIAESGVWTLGPAPGLQQVRAESGAVHVDFSALAHAPPTGLDGRIAFVSGRDGNPEIYAINVDGSGLERLTTNSAPDVDPAWSPDGSRIAFSSDRDGGSAIYVMTADGSNVARRTNDLLAWAREPAWSPDASLIAFTALHDGEFAIATVDEAHATIRFLTTMPGFNAQASWAPDGKHLAFVSDRDAYDFLLNIYTMNDDGSGQQLRTQGFGFWPEQPWDFHPVWSPDGRMIAFVHGTIIAPPPAEHWPPYVRFNIAVMSADGAFVRDLVWAGDISWVDDLDPGSITWSPDGSAIAYTFVDCYGVFGSNCSNVRSVKVVSVDGVQRGTVIKDAESPSWRR